jgi:hypothetical protein
MSEVHSPSILKLVNSLVFLLHILSVASCPRG